MPHMLEPLNACSAIRHTKQKKKTLHKLGIRAAGKDSKLQDSSDFIKSKNIETAIRFYPAQTAVILAV